MVTKWTGQGTILTASAVGNPVNTIDLPATPDTQGPFAIIGVPPPELRGWERFWIRHAALDQVTVHKTRHDASVNRGARAIALWALSFTFATTDVIVAADTITEAGHGMQTGDGPIRVSSSTTLPAGLAAATDYWVIRVDDNTIKLATSKANALAGTAINITDQGTGTHTLTRDVKVAKDLGTQGGIVEWLAQGVKPAAMRTALVAAADSIFT